jgi:hypothetical protein
VAGLGLWGQPEAVPHVIGYGLGDLLARAEPRHLLEALQVSQQRQQRLRVSVRSRAQAISSGTGVKNTCSTRAEVSRLNCG